MPRSIEAESPDKKRKVVTWAPREHDLQHPFGKCPKNVGSKQQLQLLKHCETFVATGKFPNDTSKFKHEEGELFRLKAWKVRVFGFFEDDYETFVTVHCSEKKSQKDTKQNRENVATAIKKIPLAKADKEYIDED